MNTPENIAEPSILRQRITRKNNKMGIEFLYQTKNV